MELDVLYNEDCLEGLRKLTGNSVDAVITDPPYGLAFMGRKWDYDVPSVEIWREVYRVLKPGGHLLSFGGSRTYHRMAVAIEDAGFEIRDQLMWIYGSGFPKSLDVSKAIDKAAGAERSSGGREWSGGKRSGGIVKDDPAETTTRRVIFDTPATGAAKQWQGWGTALKPAHEPIVMARKPLVGTVAENVLEHGTGAINIEACRVGTTRDVPASLSQNKTPHSIYGDYGGGAEKELDPNMGRWPANVILDEEAGAALDGKTDNGGASRFFYCAKASRRERGEGNNHPTVKPIALMEYLVRLVTPVGGVVLDPFAGSGTTLLACMATGARYVGFERDPGYFAIAEQRIGAAQRLERCDREIEQCRRASGDPSRSIVDRVGAQHGELDWIVARQLIEEEASA